GHQEWLRDQERLAAIRNDVGRVVKAVGSLSENEAEGVERFNELLIGNADCACGAGFASGDVEGVGGGEAGVAVPNRAGGERSGAGSSEEEAG
ncbi:MAG: hypothetical protein ACXWC8_20635, partial [Limisphaerales bacterium]